MKQVLEAIKEEVYIKKFVRPAKNEMGIHHFI